MKVVILGKGYVGMSLYRCLHKCYDVIHLSRRELDYTNRHVLKNYIKGQREPVRLVINTCGYTGRPNVDACEHNISDTWYYNVIVPVNIQKVCKDLIVPLVHISSGCIYTGYDKEFTEDDEPNFGLHNPDSSWYSKTKHACEMMLADTPTYIFRIRMPFCDTMSPRSILTKLLKYDNVIDMNNSLTNLEDLCGFVLYFSTDLLDSGKTHPYGIYNVVNPQPVSTGEIIQMLKQKGLNNPNWKTISLDQLYETTATKRSNCVLSDKKISDLNLKLPNTVDSLYRCMNNIASNDKLVQER